MQKSAIETRALARRFGTQIAVDQLNLFVPEAGVYGFLGPNGAGKTTTIRMLLGLIRPNAGEVHLFGAPLAADRLSLMRMVGALVETPSLYSHLTGRENLEITRRLLGAPRGLIDEALGVAKLAQDAHRRVREYSMGMRQRLGLALALLNKPRLLILDEPTNGLDPAGIHEMRDLIRRLPAEFGATVFLSSHLLSEVEQIASHIGIIHQGRLLFQGTLNELQAQRRERLILGVNQPEQAMRSLAASGWIAQRDNEGLLSIPASSGELGREAAARINSMLVNQGLEVFHMALAQDSLEEIFLTMTDGRGDAKRTV